MMWVGLILLCTAYIFYIRASNKKSEKEEQKELSQIVLPYFYQDRIAIGTKTYKVPMEDTYIDTIEVMNDIVYFYIVKDNKVKRYSSPKKEFLKAFEKCR